MESALLGRTLSAAARRGKFLWLPIADEAGQDTPDSALLIHLGMSGQLRVTEIDEVAREPGDHVRVRLTLGVAAVVGERPEDLDPALILDFVDQRTFGHLSVARLIPTADGLAGGRGTTDPLIPEPVAHIARDLLDPDLDLPALIQRIQRRRTGVKRALLDQRLVSGIGNIYADEALWRAELHYAAATDRLTTARLEGLLTAAQDVMTEALHAGGTSFDALYVNVNGSSGYFSRSLAVYGQHGLPCPRCGTPIVREPFANRSSHFCPVCQRIR